MAGWLCLTFAWQMWIAFWAIADSISKSLSLSFCQTFFKLHLILRSGIESAKCKNNYENQNSISKLLKPKSKKSYNFFCYRRVNFFNLINTVRMRNFCGFKRQLLLWVSVCIFGGMSAVRAAKEAKNLIKTLHKWNSNWVLHAKWIIEWTMAVD